MMVCKALISDVETHFQRGSPRSSVHPWRRAPTDTEAAKETSHPDRSAWLLFACSLAAAERFRDTSDRLASVSASAKSACIKCCTNLYQADQKASGDLLDTRRGRQTDGVPYDNLKDGFSSYARGREERPYRW